MDAARTLRHRRGLVEARLAKDLAEIQKERASLRAEEYRARLYIERNRHIIQAIKSRNSAIERKLQRGVGARKGNGVSAPTDSDASDASFQISPPPLPKGLGTRTAFVASVDSDFSDFDPSFASATPPPAMDEPLADESLVLDNIKLFIDKRAPPPSARQLAERVVAAKTARDGATDERRAAKEGGDTLLAALRLQLRGGNDTPSLEDSENMSSSGSSERRVLLRASVSSATGGVIARAAGQLSHIGRNDDSREAGSVSLNLSAGAGVGGYEGEDFESFDASARSPPPVDKLLHQSEISDDVKAGVDESTEGGRVYSAGFDGPSGMSEDARGAANKATVDLNEPMPAEKKGELFSESIGESIMSRGGGSVVDSLLEDDGGEGGVGSDSELAGGGLGELMRGEIGGTAEGGKSSNRGSSVLDNFGSWAGGGVRVGGTGGLSIAESVIDYSEEFESVQEEGMDFGDSVGKSRAEISESGGVSVGGGRVEIETNSGSVDATTGKEGQSLGARGGIESILDIFADGSHREGESRIFGGESVSDSLGGYSETFESDADGERGLDSKRSVAESLEGSGGSSKFEGGSVEESLRYSEDFDEERDAAAQSAIDSRRGGYSDDFESIAESKGIGGVSVNTQQSVAESFGAFEMQGGGEKKALGVASWMPSASDGGGGYSEDFEAEGSPTERSGVTVLASVAESVGGGYSLDFEAEENAVGKKWESTGGGYSLDFESEAEPQTATSKREDEADSGESAEGYSFEFELEANAKRGNHMKGRRESMTASVRGGYSLDSEVAEDEREMEDDATEDGGAHAPLPPVTSGAKRSPVRTPDVIVRRVDAVAVSERVEEVFEEMLEEIALGRVGLGLLT